MNYPNQRDHLGTVSLILIMTEFADHCLPCILYNSVIVAEKK